MIEKEEADFKWLAIDYRHGDVFISLMIEVDDSFFSQKDIFKST